MSSATRGIDGRIFVVGVPRSGTTLVQSLLAAHGATTSFTESHFFDRHFRLLPPSSRAILIRNPEPRLREFLAENDEPAPDAAAWFAANGRGRLGARALLPLRTRATARQLLRVLDQLALRRGKAYWIEKTPRHLRYLPLIERLPGLEPRPRFIHVIRDGLEVVASLERASRSWQRPYDLAACVRRWNADVEFSLGRIGSPRDRFVVYEELTARPEATLRRLFAGLGLAWEPGTLERFGDTSTRLVTPREEGWKGDVGREIRRSATARRSLTAEQRNRVAGALRRGLYERICEHAGGVAAADGGAGG